MYINSKSQNDRNNQVSVLHDHCYECEVAAMRDSSNKLFSVSLCTLSNSNTDISLKKGVSSTNR